MTEFMSDPEIPYQPDAHGLSDHNLDAHDPTTEVYYPDGTPDTVRSDGYAATEFLPDGYAEAEGPDDHPLVLDVRQFDGSEALDGHALQEARTLYKAGVNPYFWSSPESQQYTDRDGMSVRNITRTVTDESGTTVLEIGNRPRAVDVTFTDAAGVTTRSIYFADNMHGGKDWNVRRHDYAYDDLILPAEGLLPTSQHLQLQQEIRRHTTGSALDQLVGPEEMRNLVSLIGRGSPPEASVAALHMVIDNRAAALATEDRRMPGQYDMSQGVAVLDDAVREAFSGIGQEVDRYETKTRFGVLKFTDPVQGRMRIIIERSYVSRQTLTTFRIQPEAGSIIGYTDDVVRCIGYGSTVMTESAGSNNQSDSAESWRVRDILRAAIKQQAEAQQ